MGVRKQNWVRSQQVERLTLGNSGTESSREQKALGIEARSSISQRC